MDKQAFATIIHHISEGLITVNKEGIIELFNPAAEKYLHTKASNVLHHPYNKHFNNDTFTDFVVTAIPQEEGFALLFCPKCVNDDFVHDIRNPLSGIRGFAELLLRDLKDQPKQARMAEYIIQGADELNEVLKRSI